MTTIQENILNFLTDKTYSSQQEIFTKQFTYSSCWVKNTGAYKKVHKLIIDNQHELKKDDALHPDLLKCLQNKEEITCFKSRRKLESNDSFVFLESDGSYWTIFPQSDYTECLINLSSSTSVDTNASFYEGVYDFVARESGELSFKSGDVLEIIDKDNNGWWHAKKGNEQGLVPSNYLQSYQKITKKERKSQDNFLVKERKSTNKKNNNNTNITKTKKLTVSEENKRVIEQTEADLRRRISSTNEINEELEKKLNIRPRQKDFNAVNEDNKTKKKPNRRSYQIAMESMEPRNIILIGKTGNGKSTLANVISRTNKFKESEGAVSETKDMKIEDFEENGTRYS